MKRFRSLAVGLAFGLSAAAAFAGSLTDYG